MRVRAPRHTFAAISRLRWYQVLISILSDHHSKATLGQVSTKIGYPLGILL